MKVSHAQEDARAYRLLQSMNNYSKLWQYIFFSENDNKMVTFSTNYASLVDISRTDRREILGTVRSMCKQKPVFEYESFVYNS